jgi:hypothetical protein
MIRIETDTEYGVMPSYKIEDRINNGWKLLSIIVFSGVAVAYYSKKKG